MAKNETTQKKEQAKKKDKVEERAKRLILVIGKDILPRKQIMADLGLRQRGRRNFYTNYLNPALAKEYVRFAIPEAHNSPDQAYRLTSIGLEIYNEIINNSNSLK